MSHIQIIEGDITTAEVDAIVNAANPKMLGGGGVDGAIHRAAGKELLQECRKVKPINGIRCSFGSAQITKAGDLKSKYVIHAVGPIYRNELEPSSTLTGAYENSLILAVKNDCKSIAFPAISCGAYGYPLDEAARVAVNTCNKYVELDIYFYLMGARIIDSWKRALLKDSAHNKSFQGDC